MTKILSFNVKEKIKDFYLDLLIESIEQRPRLELQDGNNYLFKSKYTNELYDIFISLCKKHLNSFTIKSLNFKTYCCLSDKNFQFNINQWHNHEKTGTIIGVLYLKIPNKKENGIDFKLNNQIVKYEPEPFDLIIFPSYLDHRPHSSKTDKKRISINIELQCKESSQQIFHEL